MKPSLKTGLTFEFQFPVPEERTVPHLLPESPEFQLMPQVLASGYTFAGKSSRLTRAGSGWSLGPAALAAVLLLPCPFDRGGD